jgi:uncharacterized protein YidB (DUF937 family)
MKQVWKPFVAAAVLLALAAVAAGIISAQEPTSTEEPQATPTDAEQSPTPGADEATPDGVEDKEARIDNFLERLAANLGVSVDELEQALRDTQLDLLDEAVADGRIDEADAAEIRERIESGDAPLFPFFFGRHHGGPGPGLGACIALDEVADFLGVEESVIHDGLRDGQTLAQIAEANGSTADALAAHLLSQLETRLNEAVANGDITQERADEVLANAPERINDMINREGPGPGRFRMAPGIDPPGSLTPPAIEESVFF